MICPAAFWRALSPAAFARAASPRAVAQSSAICKLAHCEMRLENPRDRQLWSHASIMGRQWNGPPSIKAFACGNAAGQKSDASG